MVRGVAHIGGDQQVRKRHLLRHFMLQLISLPRRQARDKHGMFFKNSGVSYREWAELTFPPLPKVAATRASSSQAMEEEFVEDSGMWICGRLQTSQSVLGGWPTR